MKEVVRLTGAQLEKKMPEDLFEELKLTCTYDEEGEFRTHRFELHLEDDTVEIKKDGFLFSNFKFFIED